MTITVSGIHKRFGRYPALNGVDLGVKDREFLALLGPSGSGKTTLLRIIAGLEFADAGTVAFAGQDMSAVPVSGRNVGFVFQQYALFRHMTVADNVAFGLRVKPRRERPGKAAIAARVAELLALVQLPDLGGRYPAQLSGGQRQRVALARALATDPRILLLDEPFGALDAKVRKELRHWLRRLHEEVGLTSIFVTHDQEEAIELADRVVVMNQGAIEQIADPRTLYDAPASAFVHDFVGETNHLAVAISAGRARLGEVPLDLPAAGLADGPATLILRPHELALAADGVPAEVLLVHPQGGGSRVEARIAGRAEPLEIDVAGPPPAPGDQVRLRVTGGRLYPAPS